MRSGSRRYAGRSSGSDGSTRRTGASEIQKPELRRVDRHLTIRTMKGGTGDCLDTRMEIINLCYNREDAYRSYIYDAVGKVADRAEGFMKDTPPLPEKKAISVAVRRCIFTQLQLIPPSTVNDRPAMGHKHRRCDAADTALIAAFAAKRSLVEARRTFYLGDTLPMFPQRTLEDVFIGDFVAPAVTEAVTLLFKRMRARGAASIPQILDFKFWRKWDDPYGELTKDA